MTFSIPEPFISHTGKVSIELEEKTLYGRLIQHIARQWPEHEVVGFRFVVSVIQWNNATEDAARVTMLDKIKEALFGLAAQDGLSIIGLGPVMLLPPDNSVPPAPGLSRLLKITPSMRLPTGATMEQNYRMLYQQAHVIEPMTP